jgi:phosphatidylserine decarboxylase
VRRGTWRSESVGGKNRVDPGACIKRITDIVPIAREGLREILLATVVFGVLAALSIWLLWPAAIAWAVLWLWVLTFFRDPRRQETFGPGVLCAPADGTVTEITKLEAYEPLGGPAVRIGVFLSLFDVHINRSPCSGVVRSVTYRPGEFLDARHKESGRRNESNTLLIDPDAPITGPIEVRQVAGVIARRIICHANVGDHVPIGARFGLIKFGSRTELIVPWSDDTKVCVDVGGKVRAGLTALVRQMTGQAGAPDLKRPAVCEADASRCR